MLISSLSFKRLACFISASVFSVSILADVPTSSIKMPRASKSLLLDIEAIGEKIVVVGERGHILVSDDHGHSWVQADVPVAQMLNAVDFVNERLGWAVGHDGNIVHTQDGGETWVVQRDGLKAQTEFNISALSAAKARVAELQQKIDQVSLSESAEAQVDDESPGLEEQLEEANWELEAAQERLAAPAIASPLMDVWFADEKNGWAVGAFGTFLQTTDAGNTWIDHSKDLSNTDGHHLNAILGVNGIIYIAGEAGYMIHSQDNGQTWLSSDLGYDGTIFGLFAAADGSFVVATGLRGNTFRSEDHGVTWQALDPAVGYSLSGGYAYGDHQLVLVGAGGSIAISNDKGDTFKRYTLPVRASLSAVIALENGQFLLVGQGGVHRFDINSVTE